MFLLFCAKIEQTAIAVAFPETMFLRFIAFLYLDLYSLRHS
jgi:hypothetical protein